jgi:hypothetical protein
MIELEKSQWTSISPRLEAKIDHIQSDVTTIKAEMRGVEDKLDVKFGELDTKVAAKYGALDTKIDAKCSP